MDRPIIFPDSYVAEVGAAYARIDSSPMWSQEIIETSTASLAPEERDWILHGKVAELYGLD